MTFFLQFAIAVVVIIIAAKFGGYISYRLGQPSVLGELLIGIILGPSVLDLLHMSYFTETHLGESIHLMAELGVLLLMFIAGLDLHLSDLTRSGRVASQAGVLGVIFPLVLGFGVGLFFSMEWQSAIFLGLILSATSVSISAQTLIELQALRSRVGITLLGAAVIDDILVILGMSIFMAVFQAGPSSDYLDILLIILRMFLYLLAAFAIGLWILPRMCTKVDLLPISKGLISFVFITMLLYAWAAEELGSIAAITGAFLVGLMLSRSPMKDRIEASMQTLAYAVFVPIFFVNVGLSANARELSVNSLYLLIILVLTGILGKVLGSGLGAYLGGFSRLEALQLGIGMMSRGEVGLIVATVGINEGWIPREIFSAVVGVVIITTLLTPPALRTLFRQKGEGSIRKEKEIEGEST